MQGLYGRGVNRAIPGNFVTITWIPETSIRITDRADIGLFPRGRIRFATNFEFSATPLFVCFAQSAKGPRNGQVRGDGVALGARVRA